MITHDELTRSGLLPLVEIGLRLAPTVTGASAAAAEIAACLEQAPSAAVRIAAIGRQGSRVLVTLAITLGTVEEVKASAPAARSAVTLISELIERLSSFDPAFTGLPHPASTDSRIAAQVERDRRGLKARTGSSDERRPVVTLASVVHAISATS